MEQLAILAKVSTVRVFSYRYFYFFSVPASSLFSLLFTRNRFLVFLIPSTSSLFLLPIRHSSISNLHTSSHFVSSLVTSYHTQYCCGEGGDAGYQAVIDSILPVIATALEDEKPEVSTDCTYIKLLTFLVSVLFLSVQPYFFSLIFPNFFIFCAGLFCLVVLSV